MSRAERKLKKIQAKEELKRRKEEKKQQKSEAQPSKNWSEMTSGEKKITIIIAVIVFIAVVWVFSAINNASNTMNSSAEQEAPAVEAPKPTYKAKVLGYNPVDPATLRVSVEVKNTSKVEGKPDCTINASNASGTYKGFDVFGVDPIAPGKVDYFNGNLTITNEGSGFVTDVTVDCS